MQLQIQERTGSENKRDEQGDGKVKTAAVADLSHGIVQGSRLTFQLSSQVARERFDFTSQNKFSLARLFCIISYCVQRLKILTRGIQSTMCLLGKFLGAM